MTAIAILPLFSSAVIFFLGVFVFSRHPKEKLQITFLLYTMVAAALSFTESRVIYAETAERAFFWVQFNNIWPLIVVLQLNFIIVYTKSAKFVKNRLFIIILYLSGLVALYIINLTDLTIDTVIAHEWGWQRNTIYLDNVKIILTIWVSLISLLSLFLIIQDFRNSTTVEERKKTAIVGSGMLIQSIFLILAEGILPAFGIKTILPSSSPMLITSILFAVGILRYRLFLFTVTSTADTIIETISDFLFLFDLNGKIHAVNRAACDALGYSKKELLNINIDQILIHEKKDTTVYGFLTKSFDFNKNITSRELFLKSKSGRHIPIASSASLAVDKYRQSMVTVLACRDISKEKQNEQQISNLISELTRSNAELEQFAYIASHDLQEPLRMVTSYLQLLKRRNTNKLDAESHDFIQFTIDGANRMKHLIEGLLAYSRVGSEKRSFHKVDISLVIDSTLNNLKVLIGEKKAKIVYENMPVIVGDKGQLSQLIQNLIGNSLKFSGKHDPEIKVTAENTPEHWLFQVQDNGIGIASKHKDRVFNIFERLHSREEYAGTGIGLAVCKKIVERHGGKIWIESELGEGTIFFFTIPHTY
jgi:PAS domain S-box-containing protein